MAWKCIIEGKEIGDVRKDRRTAKNIDKYSVSEQAVYFDGQYLPVSEIRSMRIQPSVYQPVHSCGRGIPVFKIRLDYGGEKPAVLMIERERTAEKAAAMIREANPEICLEEYVDPLTGEKPDRMLHI